MGRWLQTLSYRLQSFLQGRYGYDQLSTALSFTGLGLFVLSLIPPLRFLYWLALAAYGWVLFRALSKNHTARLRERDAFLRVWNTVKGKFSMLRSRLTDHSHRYYACPACKATVRIPQPGKGRTIEITCPRCGKSFQKRT